jgi:hypothetical protein
MTQRKKPWGRIVGLWVGVMVAFIGAARNLDPDVVVFRAVVSGFVCGVLTFVGVFFLDILTRSP